jgi:glutaconate CoA-transferase, subunit B
VITSLGLFSFDPQSREMILSSNHPGVSVETIKAETGWPLKVSPDLRETPGPTWDELAAVRKYDPKRVWTA